MPICSVALICRHCGVLHSTPHSPKFRAPCIWTFLISLQAGLVRRAFFPDTISEFGILES